MCILSYLAPGIDVDMEGLYNGGISNPDGHGWALTGDEYVMVGKSLDLNEALDDFAAARKANPGSHALFHSRWATHGAITTDNVHPFYVRGQGQQTVVGHNGILPRAAHPAKGDGRSDTRKFADEILSTRYRRLDKARAFTALENWIGNGNKLVILTTHGRYRRNAYIVNEHLGVWDKNTGIWHSNDAYLDMPKWYGKLGTYTKGKSGRYVFTEYGQGDWYDDEYPSVAKLALTAADKTRDYYAHGQDCAFCQLGSIDGNGYCDACGTCDDCGDIAENCACMMTGDDVMSQQARLDQEWLEKIAAEQADAQHDYS